MSEALNVPSHRGPLPCFRETYRPFAKLPLLRCGGSRECGPHPEDRDVRKRSHKKPTKSKRPKHTRTPMFGTCRHCGKERSCVHTCPLDPQIASRIRQTLFDIRTGFA